MNLKFGKKHKLIIQLRKKWGISELKECNFLEIGKYFKKAQDEKGNKNVLDDRTWNDLDMDAVFSRIDRTLSTPGDNVLYKLLREPLFDEEELEERNKIINTYLHNQELREKSQILLSKLGKERGNYLVEMLFGERPSASKFAFIYPLILIFILIFLFLGLLNFTFAWFGLGAAVACNMIFHYRTKERMYEHLSSIRYLGRLIRCVAQMEKIGHPALSKHLEDLERSLSKVAYVSRKTVLLGREGDFVLIEYFNIISLTEVRAYHSILKVLDRYEHHLQKIFHSVGFLDAMISAASFRAGLKDYTEPEFVKHRSLKFDGIIHPLLNEPVPNSIEVDSRGILVTGSNMAGKTTFLKAIGINAILAQSINTCLAQKYRSSFFNVNTLIGRADNVIEGKSYYLDEVQALLKIIESSQSDVTCLCLLDEIFRGTNSLERSAASAEVLLYLARNNCIVFATTHEYELIGIVGEAFTNYHFSEDIEDSKGISFDYRLLDGPSTQHNAIKLLKHVGYPKEVTEAAAGRIDKKTESK
jgi:DNA mismatch repair ATPase MutS